MEYKKLGHIAKIQTGPFGSQLHQSDYKPTGIPCIMPCNIGSNLNIICDNIAYISEEDLNRLAKHKTQEGDIVYSRRGDIEKCAYISSRESGWLCGTGCLKVSIDSTIALPKYVAYLLSTPESKAWLVGNAVGTTMLNLNTTVLSDFPICLPDLDTQQKVVEIIDSIADKIELNKRINDNLEQQAQALYRSWFVDFEPFCEGEFIESSLGSIPAGWKVGQLSDICEIVGGGTPSKSHPEYYCKRGIAWITPKDLSVSKSKFSSRGSEDITSDGYKNSSAKLMPRGTVLFSSRAPIGYISIATNEICTNQGFKSAVPGIAGTGYLYYFLQANTDKIESKASGSTFKEASGSLMKALEVIIPADGIFNQFEAELAPILTKQENIASEIHTLTTLRDTLLPKLMSGELKINEIDC